MEDTNIIYASLKEKMWIWTHSFSASSSEPGQILKITADPIGAMISADAATPSGGSWGSQHFASPLALTLSRFRELRYLGTRVALRPAATTGSVDPAHISMVAGQVNSVDPRDITNQIHFRRWIGDNFHVPQVDPTGTGEVYVLNDSYDLDAAWLADYRFVHSVITDGFDVFVQPLRAVAQLATSATSSLFGYLVNSSVTPLHDETAGYQAPGMTALTGGDVVPDGWLPNPLAGFKYSTKGSWSDQPAGKELVYVSGYNPMFPWFSDKLDTTGDFTVAQLYNMVRQRMLAPLMILRIPPAYGTKFYWTLYMRHYFAARKPFYVCGNWVAGHVSRLVPSEPTASGLQILCEDHTDPNGDDYHVSQLSAPDPFGSDDNVKLITMQDGSVVDGVFSPKVNGFGFCDKIPPEITEIDNYGHILNERERMASSLVQNQKSDKDASE